MQGRYDETVKKLHEVYQKVGRSVVVKEKRILNQPVPNAELKKEIGELKAYQRGIQTALAVLEVDQQQEMLR